MGARLRGRPGSWQAVAMRRIVTLLLCLFAAPAWAEPITVIAAPVVLDEEDPARSRAGGLHFLAGFALDSPDRRFGGLSAIRFTGGPDRMLALTDRGARIVLALRHRSDGVLAGVAGVEIGRLNGTNGAALPGETAWQDAESLAQNPAGGWWVGFERRHRIAAYDAGLAGPAALLPVPPALGDAPKNGGLESLVTLADGRLLAVSEGLVRDDGLTAAWLWDGSAWAALGYAARAPYKPTAAARLPGGDLLFVERRYNPVTGAGALIRRLSPDAVQPGAVLSPALVATLEPPLIVDNYEGLAVRPAPDGDGALIYLMSDDNFFPLQRTLLLQFRLGG